MRAAEFVAEKWSQKYKRSINCAHPKGFSQRAHCAGRKKNEDLEENLRDWFGKGKAGGAGGGGWDRYNTKGERIGKCGDRKPGEGKPKCLSKSRAASLRASGGKQAIATAVRRKRTKDTDPERSGAARNVPNKTQNENKDIETELLKKQLMARHPQAKNLSNAMALDYFKSQQQDRRDIVRLDRENDQEEAEIERLDQENDQEETEIERLKRTINQLTRGS
jgi:hypothetical protein